MFIYVIHTFYFCILYSQYRQSSCCITLCNVSGFANVADCDVAENVNELNAECTDNYTIPVEDDKDRQSFSSKRDTFSVKAANVDNYDSMLSASNKVTLFVYLLYNYVSFNNNVGMFICIYVVYQSCRFIVYILYIC